MPASERTFVSSIQTSHGDATWEVFHGAFETSTHGFSSETFLEDEKANRYRRMSRERPRAYGVSTVILTPEGREKACPPVPLVLVLKPRTRAVQKKSRTETRRQTGLFTQPVAAGSLCR